MAFKEIDVYELNENTFDMINKQWMLVTAAKDKENVNTMTASWGGLGILWGKPVAYVFIRPQRYTKEYIDNSNGLSLTFFDESYRKMLGYMGSVSGRDADKIKESNLNVVFDDKVPYFEEAKIVVKTKKLYAQPMDSKYLTDSAIDEKWYPQHDWHTMYICEIEKILVRE